MTGPLPPFSFHPFSDCRPYTPRLCALFCMAVFLPGPCCPPVSKRRRGSRQALQRGNKQQMPLSGSCRQAEARGIGHLLFIFTAPPHDPHAGISVNLPAVP